MGKEEEEEEEEGKKEESVEEIVPATEAQHPSAGAEKQEGLQGSKQLQGAPEHTTQLPQQLLNDGIKAGKKEKKNQKKLKTPQRSPIFRKS